MVLADVNRGLLGVLNGNGDAASASELVVQRLVSGGWHARRGLARIEHGGRRESCALRWSKAGGSAARAEAPVRRRPVPDHGDGGDLELHIQSSPSSYSIMLCILQSPNRALFSTVLTLYTVPADCQ
jgi:hypothetical protein